MEWCFRAIENEEMRTNHYIFLLVACLCMAGVLGCDDKQSCATSMSTPVDHFLASRQESIFSAPKLMMERFKMRQKGLTDSAEVWKLRLFEGYCILQLTGRTDSAMQVNDQALAYCKQHPEEAALELMCWNHRSILLQQVDMDSAIACLHHAVEAAYRTPWREELVTIYINLADNCRMKGDIPATTRYYARALYVSDSLGQDESLMAIYTGLGQAYTTLHNYDRATDYFHMAEAQSDRCRTYERFHYLNSLGNMYYEQGEYVQALPVFQRAYALAQQFHSAEYEAIVECNLGELQTLLGNYDSAHYYLDKAQAFIHDTPSQDMRFYLTTLYASLAFREGDMNGAKKYLSRSFDRRIISPHYIYLREKMLHDYYAMVGDYERAYRYMQLAKAYDDSLRNATNFANILETRQRYAQDTASLHRDMQLIETHAKTERQIYSIVLLLVGLFMLTILVILHDMWNTRKHERMREKERNRVVAMRMRYLRNFFKPHTIFNLLNLLIPQLRGIPSVNQMLELLIRSLRDALMVADQSSITLQQEMDIVRDNIRIRELLGAQMPRVEWDIAGDVPLHTPVVPTLLQVPVVNVLKHAFPTHSDEDCLTIRCRAEAEGITILVQDNGTGFEVQAPATPSENGTGTGLWLITESLRLLNNGNAKKMTYETHSSQKGPLRGTRVEIFVPFVYKFSTNDDSL